MTVATATYLLSIFLLRTPLMKVGTALGLSGWLAYTIPGLLIWASIYRLGLDSWGWPDGVAIVVLGALGMIYFGGSIQIVAYELVKTLTGFGALSVITYSLLRKKGGSSQ